MCLLLSFMQKPPLQEAANSGGTGAALVLVENGAKGSELLIQIVHKGYILSELRGGCQMLQLPT